MSDIDEGDLQILLQTLELDLVPCGLGIEGAKRLIQQQNRGVQDQGSSQCDMLVLATRQLGVS